MSDTDNPGKEVSLWADSFMFKAEEINPDDGPRVYLLSANHDPLGSIAAAAKAYMGEFVTSLAEITDEERSKYLTEIQKTALAMPLESVNFQFRITGVTRGFTHQLVRQRTAAYSQESTRFAVKESVPVGLPPSLAGTLTFDQWSRKELDEFKRLYGVVNGKIQWNNLFAYGSPNELHEYIRDHASKEQRWRFKWDNHVRNVERVYNELVNDGMPAEDARGLLPTNLLTQVNYHVNLRNLQTEAGKRLCTQAQFEWRLVWAEIVKAIREYGQEQWYDVLVNYGEEGDEARIERRSSMWQLEALSKVFKPICYQYGKCPMKASFDRKCSIRDRVDANAKIGRDSTEWGEDAVFTEDGKLVPESHMDDTGEITHLGIPAIRSAEWLLDPAAAR